MHRPRIVVACFVLFVFSTGLWFGRLDSSHAAAPDEAKVYEIRTYTTHEGRLDALNARFRNHTIKLLEKHGMKNVAYWVPVDSPLSKNTLIYILEHPSREAAKKNWEAFGKDPEWHKVRAQSEADGKIVSRVEAVFMRPTDYSPLQ